MTAPELRQRLSPEERKKYDDAMRLYGDAFVVRDEDGNWTVADPRNVFPADKAERPADADAH